MDNIWTVLCNKTLANPETGTISLIDVVEKVTIGLSPEEDIDITATKIKIPSDLHLVSLFQTEKPGISFNLKVILTTPKGSSHEIFNQNYKLPKEQKLFRHNLHVKSFHIEGEGTYYFLTQTKTTKAKAFEDGSRIPIQVSLGVNPKE
ncbi:hypothetical protein HYV12_01400 [Candidatus Dojkabacteria bacterium]|nr:hypothetical protein [Candidatus Dojkabacteria bacterium]